MSLNVRAPNILSGYYYITDGCIIIFPWSPERTYFAIQNADPQILVMWVGDNPPIDKTEWISIAGSTSDDMFYFHNGCAGPIHLSELGGGGEGVRWLSTRTEDDLIECPTPT